MQDLDTGFVVITGRNGAGKTNCLEAVSLLSPGRGLRNANPHDLKRNIDEIENARTGTDQNIPQTAPYNPLKRSTNWVIQGSILCRTTHDHYSDDLINIGTGQNPTGQGRIAKINGEKISALSHLSDVFSCIWFTPAMSGLFMGSVSERRRFFDRLVFSYDPSHAGRLRRYEKLLSERSKILKTALNNNTKPDPIWLDGIEISLAETSVALAASRLELLERLEQLCVDVAGGLFPPLSLNILGGPEEMLKKNKALNVEDFLKSSFKDNRIADTYTGGSATSGAHRSDLDVIYLNKNMPADQCSTGEQKALLLTIILAHAKFIHAKHGRPPAVLLDEISAHLDEKRRHALFEILSTLKGQVWMTGTEKNLFDGLSDAQYFEIENASVSAV